MHLPNNDWTVLQGDQLGRSRWEALHQTQQQRTIELDVDSVRGRVNAGRDRNQIHSNLLCTRSVLNSSSEPTRRVLGYRGVRIICCVVGKN